jgi:mRNA interferase RelE/StbE
MSRYTIYVTPDASNEIRNLPGNIRQRVRRAIDRLAEKPHPAGSKALEIPDLDYEVWRLRLDKWRVIYAITEADRTIDVLAVRKRPPYDYGDLEELLANVG